MRGRPPKPTELHKLQGTFNVTRHGRDRKGEPRPQGDLEEPPEWLSEGQVASWRYVLDNAPKGLLKKLDRGLLELWVTAEDLVRIAVTAQARLNEASPQVPLLVKGANGLAISPYVEVIKEMAKIMLSASDRLGFSPVARPRIQLDPQEPQAPESPLARLRCFPVIPGGKDQPSAPQTVRKKSGPRT